MSRSKKFLLVVITFLVMAMLVTLPVKADNSACGPGKVCSFGFPTYADAACLQNMRELFSVKGNSWTIPGNGSDDYNGHFGSFSGSNYHIALGIPAGCLCEAATMFNYLADINGLKVSFVKHSPGVLVPGIPPGYETAIWNPGTTMTIRNPNPNPVTFHWQVTGSGVQMWLDGGNSVSTILSTPKPVTTSIVVPSQNGQQSTPVPSGLPANSPKWVKDIDDIVNVIKYVPGQEAWGRTWELLKGYLQYIPWVVAGLIVLLFLTVVKPVIGWLVGLIWAWTGKKYDRKKKHFFRLTLFLVLYYWLLKIPEGALALKLAEYTGGIWVFFTVTGWLYKTWRHFNYDPVLEARLKAGLRDRWEWLREATLGPTLIAVLVAILAYTFGYYWFQVQVANAILEANKPVETGVVPWSPAPTIQVIQVPKPTATPTPILRPTSIVVIAPPPESLPVGNVGIKFNCNFDPIKAGLGPVKVGCDANGLPTFPIRWWNGNLFTFRIPKEIWNVAVAAGDTPEAILGIIDFGAAESTAFTNYQNENYAGAAGTFQFLAGTFSHWAPSGFSDPKYRLDPAIAAKAVANMQKNGMKQIYAMHNQVTFESCFQGGSGCNTWNHHAAQANFAWRLMVALRVAAGIQ